MHLNWGKLHYLVFVLFKVFDGFLIDCQFIFNWRVKLKKNQFSKREKKRIKIDIKNKNNVVIKMWNWKEY